MILRSLEVGQMAANCYILGDPKTRRAIVIDAGGDAERILGVLEAEGLTAEYIVSTHGHYDHTGADDALAKATGAPVCIHRLDAAMLAQPETNLAAFMGGDRAGLQGGPQAGRLLECGQRLQVGEMEAEVWCTPGHTSGSISLLVGDHLFTGDLLFQHSVGRQDLPGGSWADMKASLLKVMALPGETKVHPGHGPSTTIDEERRRNPYVVPLLEETRGGDG